MQNDPNIDETNDGPKRFKVVIGRAAAFEHIEGQTWSVPCRWCRSLTHFNTRKPDVLDAWMRPLCRDCRASKSQRGILRSRQVRRWIEAEMRPHPWRMKMAEMVARGIPGTQPTIRKAIQGMVDDGVAVYRNGWLRTLSVEETEIIRRRNATRGQSIEEAMEELVFKKVIPTKFGSVWIDEGVAIDRLMDRGFDRLIAEEAIHLAVLRGKVRRGAIKRRIRLPGPDGWRKPRVDQEGRWIGDDVAA